MKKFVSIFLILVMAIGLFTGCGDTSSSSSSAGPSKSYKTAIADTDFFAAAMDANRDYLAVYNDENQYKFDSPYDISLQDDLVYTPDDYTGDMTRVEKAAYYAFRKMQFDLEQEKDVKIGLFSAHLTDSEQQAVYDYYSNLEGWKETNKTARPGYSENHTGLLLNILIWYSEDGENYVWYTETAERQATIPYFKQVHEVLADYGFIDRYPAGKEDITGMPNEPYLIRFVGSTRIAHDIMDNHLCLEEYNEKQIANN